MLSNKGRHDTTKLGPNAVQELKINQRRILIDSLEIGIPAPEQMIALGERQLPNGIKVGQLLNSKTLNYKKFTPHRDGLFCERIFGPVQSFVCACGKKKESVQSKSRQKDLVKTKLLPEVGEVEVTSSLKKEALFCPKCQVEYISKNVRRHRLGYIKLFAPVTHIWYLKGRPSYLSLFLGKRKKAITSLAYCNAYLVEQVYSHLETKNQVKDTPKFVSEGVRKFKQNQALSAITQTNNVKIWQNFNDRSKKKEDYKKVALEESVLSSIHKKYLQPRMPFLAKKSITKPHKNPFVTGAEPFFSLLKQLFPEKSVKNFSFNEKNETIKKQNVNIDKVFHFHTELAVTKTEFLLKQDTQRCDKKSTFLPEFLSLNKRYAGLIRPYLLTKRYKAVTKLTSWLKLPPERSLGTINNRAEQSGYQDHKLSGKQTRANQSFALTSSSKVSAEKSTGKFLLSPYVRAQTSPFLPSFICSFHLRDCLISFLQSSPRTEDIPIPSYCQAPRRYPLRDVHKFLTEFRSTTTKNQAEQKLCFCERLTSESIKKFTGLPKQAKPILNKKSVFVQSYSKMLPNKALPSFQKSCRDLVVHKGRHANLLSQNKIDVFAYKISTKKHKIDEKGTSSARFLPTVENFSAYIRKPNVTAKIYNRSNAFTKVKVSTLAVNLEGVNQVSMKKADFLQKVIENQRNKDIDENGRYRQLKGLTKQSENLSMPTQFLARKTTISSILLKTFIDMLLPDTAPISCWLPLLRYKDKDHSNFTPLALTKQSFVTTKLQNQVTLYNLYKQKTKPLQKLYKNFVFVTRFCIPSRASVKSFVTSFATNALFDKNSVKTKTNKETYIPYFDKTSTHNALVKAKFLPMHYKRKQKDVFNSYLLNFQLIAAGSKFREKAKLCKENVFFTNIETYQTRLLYLVFGTEFQSQSTELYEGITKPKQSKALLPFYSAFTNHYYFPFSKREKKPSSSSEHFFPHSFDLLKPKLIAGLSSNQDRLSQYRNIYLKIYSSHSCTVLVKQKSEKGVTFFSRSRLNVARKIGSNGDFTVSFSIDLPFFISGSNQNRVCLITQKENKIERNKINRRTDKMFSSNIGQTKLRSTANFISSSLPDVSVWSCTLVKRFLINSCFHSNEENVVFLHLKEERSSGEMHTDIFSSGSLAKTSIEQRYASKLRTIPHKLHSERYVRTHVPARLQSNVVSLPESTSQLKGSVLFENLVRSKQKPFAQSTKAFTNKVRVKVNSRSSIPVFEDEAFTQTLSKWHINGAKEILSYTGGGALESLLKRFNISLFCQFLFGEIQILRKYYKDQIVAEYNKNQILDSHRDFPSQGLNGYTYLRKNEVGPTFSAPKRSYDLTKTAVQAEVQDSYQVGPERHFGLKYVVTDKNANLFCRRIYRTTRRLKIVQLLMRSKRRPEWMMISVLPVLPPDLRPVLQMGENLIVASDLNTLYQRVIYRNNRHYKGRFLDFHFVSSIHRLVQDAVDRLIENGKGGSTPFLTPGGRPLKSLSDILKGKRGRFRFNLLGKRVDFSGRSVIVVSPNLKIHECGLPREMALELYKYLLIRKLLLKKHVSSIVNAKKLIKQRKPLIWDMLREIIYYHPLLLNRAPTLHRLGIQAFQPKLALGNAILLHPLVCAGFNADFDGDQMGVHLPLSPQARAEAWDLLWSRNNLLSPATGQPILLPSQDMVLGFYYMTALLPYGTTFRPPNEDDQKTTYKNNVLQNFVLQPPVVHVFSDTFQVVNAYQKKQIDIQTPIWLKRVGKSENGEKSQIPLELRINTFGYRTQIYPTYKSKSKVFRDTNTSFLTFHENQAFTEHIRTTVGRVLVNNLISKNN